MKRKKCYLRMYLNENLGDDLFAKIISERYSNIKFIKTSYNRAKSNWENIKVIKNILFRIINKILKILTNNKVTIEKMLAKKLETTLVIGGSLFMEGKSEGYEELKKSNRYCIIGTNFGPYQTEEYLEKNRRIFENAEYVCFRDTKSYDLFKENNVHINVAADIIFSLDTNNIKITNNKKVIISVIDCSTKLDRKYEHSYDEKIIELTEYFIKHGYEVIYMSFCKNENDELAIERIIDKLDENLKNKVSKYYYRGNIEEALNVLGDSQVILGSRFHANIIGLILNKTIIPIIYSDKTTNVLQDINYKGKVIDIRKLDEFKVSDITNEDLVYKIDISKQIKDSQTHFVGPDRMFKK